VLGYGPWEGVWFRKARELPFPPYHVGGDGSVEVGQREAQNMIREKPRRDTLLRRHEKEETDGFQRRKIEGIELISSQRSS